MLHKKSEPRSRLVFRIVVLGLIAVGSLVLQYFFSRYGRAIWVLLEVAIWFFYLFYEWGTSIGRLKSRPDTGPVSLAETLERDMATRIVVVGYVILLLFVGVYWEGTGSEAVSLGPAALFWLIVPLVVFTFWRQYQLELRRSAT